MNTSRDSAKKNTKKTTKTMQTSERIQKIEFDKDNTLWMEKIITTYEVIKKSDTGCTKKIVSTDEELLRFRMFEVTPQELADYRKKGIPSFVLKMDGKLFHATIPTKLRFESAKFLGSHMCSSMNHECRRLSAASDDDGGCEKVRNYACNIEKYPWITLGYETFNTELDVFKVGRCLHYEEAPPRKSLTASELNAAKLELAMYMWEDVETLSQVRARIKKFI